MLRDTQLILGVTGSIAAFKAVYLLRELTRAGAQVTVVTTAHAERFVGALTFRTLSDRPVLSDLFDPQSPDAVEHVALAERAHALVVAPVTANLLAKAAHGIADDFLTTLLLAARCPVLMAPAMDGGMWDHAAVVAMRMREWRQADVLEVSTTSARGGNQPAVNAIASTVNDAIALFLHDDTGTPKQSSRSQLTAMDGPFQTGVDVYMPASDPPDGTITFTNMPRGDTSKPQVIRVPNWASTKHTITVMFSDFAHK